MTVPSETNKSGPYYGNGVTVDFDYDFRIVDETHLQAILTDADGVETVLTITSDYTVDGVGAAGGGSITLTVPPATGELLTIIRNVPFTQETDLENQGAYYAETVEDALDLAAMRDQQLAEEISRAVKIGVSVDPSGLDKLVSDITRLGQSADEIDTVADNIAAVVDVANNMPDVNTVAGIANEISEIADEVNEAAGSAAASAAAAAASAEEAAQHVEGVTPTVMRFSGDDVETEFDLEIETLDERLTNVYIDGVYQQKDTYEVVDGVLTFSSAPPAGTDNIEVNIGGTTAQAFAIPSNETVTPSKLVGGTVPIFETVSGMGSQSVLSEVRRIYVSGQATVGDGLGGMFIDEDNGSPVAFSSGAGDGAAARDWYRAADVARSRLDLGLSRGIQISVLEFGPYLGANEDNSATIQAAIDHAATLPQVGVVLDLCGLEWGVSSGLKCPVSRLQIQNGRFNALGTAESWGDEFMLSITNGAFRVALHRVEFNGNLIANLVDESAGVSLRMNGCALYRFKDIGITYTGGGCYYSNFIIRKFTGAEPERSKLSARTGIGLKLDGIDGRFTSGTVDGGAAPVYQSPGSHHLTLSQLHVWNSAGARNVFSGAGQNTFSPPWQVDDVSHLDVRRSGTLLTLGTDYTATLDASGYPTVVLNTALSGAQTCAITAKLPDVTSIELHGYATTWVGCYLDNGYVDLYSDDHIFSGCTSLYLSDYVSLDSHVRLFATQMNQRLTSLIWDVRPLQSSIPIFRLREAGGTWDADTAMWHIARNANVAAGPINTFNGDPSSSVVERVISRNAGARTQYRGRDTSQLVTVGADGNDFAVQTNGTTRFRIDENGYKIDPQMVGRNYPDDAAAAIGGVPIGGFYHTGGIVKVRRA